MPAFVASFWQNCRPLLYAITEEILYEICIKTHRGVWGGGGEKYRGRNEGPCSILYVHYFSIHEHIHARIRNIRNYIRTLTLINVAPVYGDSALRLLASQNVLVFLELYPNIN